MHYRAAYRGYPYLCIRLLSVYFIEVFADRYMLKYYCTNRVINLWNNLAENVVAATTASIFKNRLAVKKFI